MHINPRLLVGNLLICRRGQRGPSGGQLRQPPYEQAVRCQDINGSTHLHEDIGNRGAVQAGRLEHFTAGAGRPVEPFAPADDMKREGGRLATGPGRGLVRALGGLVTSRRVG